MKIAACWRAMEEVRGNAVLTLLGTFLLLTASAASETLAAGTWSSTGSMTVDRFSTATVLTDGRVLAAGGCRARDFDIGDAFCFSAVLASAELYDPATGAWSATGAMSVERFFHTATRLLDGRVLVAGGGAHVVCCTGGGGVVAGTSAELYDPATGTWSGTGSMNVGRAFHTATLLLDGRVLVAGGVGPDTSAELYDPSTGTWSATGSMSVARAFHTATRLRDGRVLVVGGGLTTGAELYDPRTGTWSPTGSTSALFSFSGAATLLMNGTVLATGGDANGTSAELYDPTTGSWSATGSTSGLSPAAQLSLATLLMDGTVLSVNDAIGAELYDPATGAWSPTGSVGSFSTATLLLDGRVLVAGGGNGASELFTPSPPGPLFAAVLPTSRSVQVGTAATAFAAIINTGTSMATGCQISPATTLSATFAFQTTDPATNTLTGTVNTPVDIPAGTTQTFMFAFTPTAAIPPTDVRLNFVCANATAAPVVSGIDTFLLSASTTPGPDIVALAATLNNDGIVNIPGSSATGIFSIAAVNLAAGGTITVSADTGAAILPVRIALCQTDPTTAQCVNPAVPTLNPVVTTINANAMPTFSIFVIGTSTVAFAPPMNRIFVRFTDAGGVPRGSTSVAVRTQ